VKEYKTDKIRNVALVGHQGSGKTSLVEALLFNTGATNRLGSVDSQTSISDWDEDEHARGISLSTSLLPLEFGDFKINVLDTPGHTDFQGEVKNAIYAADAVIVVVDGVSGVQVGTEMVWEYAKEYKLPIIAVINKLDRDNSDFVKVLNDLKGSFEDYRFVPIMLPIGKESDFKGVANVLTKKAYYEVGKDRSDLPDDMADLVEEAHMELVEAAAESDDELIEKYFEEGTLSNEEIREGMRKAARSSELNTVPVFVTSSTKSFGIYPLLEALTAYTPAPEIRQVNVIRDGSEEAVALETSSDDDTLAAYVFKTTNDKYVGTLNYFRVFSGKITSGETYFNANSETAERFNSLLSIRGKDTDTAQVFHAGDIGVVSKLSKTKTGETFVIKGDELTIVQPEFPDPLYAVAVTPRTQADSTKMGPTLSNLCDSDPTLRWRQDSDTRQVILEGMGDAHVSLAISRAERLGVGVDIELPKVPYRETITKEAEDFHRHKKQSGGAGQFGEVHLRVHPNVGEGFVYETKIFGGSISQSFLPSIEKGIRSVLPNGVIAGFPVVDVKAVAFDGKEHPVDSKDIAFQIAGREAFKKAFLAAAPVLMEPIMDVKITVPDSMMGDIMGDLNTRRGRVQGMDSVGNKSVVNAQAPLAEMMRYGNDLRSMTGGRGIYTMTFDRYDRVPAHLMDGIIKAHKEAEEEEN
jgi:elongation factor G